MSAEGDLMHRIAGFVRWCGALLLALASGVSTAKAEEAAPPPVSALTAEDFGRLPYIEMARLSPDGGRMVGLLAIAGVQRIAVVSLFEGGQKPILIGLGEKVDVESIRWVNDDQIVATVYAQQDVEGNLWYVSRLIGIDAHTGKITRLLWNHNGQNGADIIWLPSDGSNSILVAAQDSIYEGEDFWPTVYSVDVSNGHSKTVEKGRAGVMNWAADWSGKVRTGVAYTDNNRSFRLFYRNEGDVAFRTIDRASSRKRETLLDPVAFVPGTDDAIVIHEKDDGATGVYETNLMTQEDVRTIYTAPAGSEIEDTIVSRDGKTLLGVTTGGPTGTIHWIDPTLADLQAAFDKSVPGRSAHILSFNGDRSRMLVLVDRPDSPGLLYFFDVRDGRLQKLSAMNPTLGFRLLSPVRSITYKARDGLEIEGILTLPADRDPRRLPIVIMPHGGPWAYDSLSYDSWAQFVASRGYAVLQPNFRGSTGFGGDFTHKGEGEMGLAMQDDLSDALKWAVSQGIADPARACIVGASYGGYAAMWGIAKDPGEWRCAISIAGISSLSKDARGFDDQLMGNLAKDDWKRMTPDFAAVSPINAVDRIKTPLLLIHGDKDARVDVSQSRNMYAKMRDAGKTVEFIELDGADHHLAREVDRVAVLKAMESFLARYNPAGAPAAAATAAH
ncbi:MAG: S9 family peptidase [Sphingomonadales bacterium]|nr:S9 family peptidase [Sphingomonadales bacterium]MDE2568900.1 S9 family peptidase [Sphingomonadales bacterium]